MEFKTSVEKTAFAVKISVEIEGKVVAWCYMYVLSNDRHNEPFGFLENVYVEKEYRQQGIGKQLVAKAIEEARSRGCYKLLGTSRHTSTDVHRFYEKFGFKNHGLEFRMDLKESAVKQQD